MDNVKGRFCRLCCSDVTHTKFEMKREVLAIRLLNLSLDETDNYVICGVCSAKLNAAFSFKVMCLDTEDVILPYVNSELASLIDLRHVYLNEKIDKKSTITSDRQICRLCMQLVGDEFMPLEEVRDSNVMEKYIPEVNFSVTKDPVICKQCSDELAAHIDILKNCIYVGEKIEDDKDAYRYVKCEEIHIKSDEYGEDREPPLCKSNEEIYESKAAGQTFYESKNEIGKTYQCYNCDFRTKWRFSFVQHQKIHKNSSEMQMHKCNKCDYQAKRKGDLVTHQLRHRDPSEVQMHKCDKCDYQAIMKSNLTRHLKTHKDASELHMYICGECDYQTKWKYYLTRHQLTHKNAQMHRCDECGFQFRRRVNLLKHQWKHSNPSKRHVYKCDKCDYQTDWNKLVEHQIMHEGYSEVKIHKCPSCPFETNHKSSLVNHQTTHKDPSEVRMYECDKCDYQSKWRHNVVQHQVKH